MPQLSFFFQLKSAQLDAVMAYLEQNDQCARNRLANDLFFIMAIDRLTPGASIFIDDAGEREEAAVQAIQIIDEHIQHVIGCC